MTYYQNLNKENFWNEMYQKHPFAMKSLCDWIDAYKKEVDWNWLFGGSKDHQIKFHDIPYEMQFGILIRFFKERIGTQYDLISEDAITVLGSGKSFVDELLSIYDHELSSPEVKQSA